MMSGRVSHVLGLAAKSGLLLGAALYLGIYMVIAVQAREFIAQPLPALPGDQHPTALVLGNRAWVDGAPNPCLIGRVDKGLEVLRFLNGSTLVVSGGLDREDMQFESQVMADHAVATGFTGTVVQERQSTSTYENLKYSTPLLEAAGSKRVVIVTEPYHLWRTRLMVQAQGLNKQFEVHYAAAQSACWKTYGMLFKGSLREPLAVGKSFLQGYFW
ncbi:MAG: YdcF family protein [Burkholderiaceae bacterium]|nr:YdcF family protein [Burkholderiaceae bacterium]